MCIILSGTLCTSCNQKCTFIDYRPQRNRTPYIYIHNSNYYIFYNIFYNYLLWQPSPVLWPRKSHGQRSLVGCSPWGHNELNMTERLHYHFSLSCIGEGNGNPLQCSFLENPRDGRAWWAAVYGVTQSQTRLK